MRIKKIYIENFKGISGFQIVNFSKMTTLLTGPNGFGKTTIFDVLEICITGEMTRTMEHKKVPENRSSPDDVFYRNTANKPVLLKVWFENGDTNFIIEKYLNSDCHKENPKDAFNVFQTFSGAPDAFTNEAKNYKKSNVELEQEEIDTFFKVSNGQQVKDLYRLFNYIQQEETLYFLKKTAHEKKEELSFMFNTDSLESGELKSLKDYLVILNNQKKNITDELDNLSLGEKKIKTHYKKLFRGEGFDEELLFSDLTIKEAEEEKDYLVESINNLINFKELFSPKDYFLKKEYERIVALSAPESNNFLRYFILQDFLKEEVFFEIQKVQQDINDINIYEYFILQKFIDPQRNSHDILLKLNEKIELYENFLKKKESEKINSLESVLNKEKYNEVQLKSLKTELEVSKGRLSKKEYALVVFLENVKGFAKHDNGKTLIKITDTLKEIGYTVFNKILKSSDYGVPQARERIYIVAFHKRTKVKNFKYPEPIKETVVVKDILEKGKPELAKIIERDDIVFSKKDTKEKHRKPYKIGIINKGGQGERVYSVNSAGITLSAYGGGVAGKTGAYLVGKTIRKLSPRECARMQGFPEDFEIPVSVNLSQKQFGDSVSVPVIRLIAKNILSTLNKNKDEK